MPGSPMPQPQTIDPKGSAPYAARFFVWLVAIASSMGGFLFGYEIGIINQILTMRTFNVTFGLTVCDDVDDPRTCRDPPGTSDYKKGLITSSFLFGCIIGAALVSILADKAGRKPVIMMGGLLFTVGGAIQTFAPNIEVLVFSRVVSGVSIGMLSMSVPLYISETSPPQIRGRLTTIYQLMITFGIFIASCVNGIILKTVPEESHLRWHLAFAMQMIPGLVMCAVMFRMPRSPRWLAEKGRHEEGLATIARLRGMDVNARSVEVEYGAIRAGIEFERQIGTATWSELFRPGVRRRLVIGVVNQFFQQWTGINVILYYGASLFDRLGFEVDLSSIVFVIVNTFINLVSTIPGMWGVERFGRRPLLIWGGILMMVAHLMIFTFGYITQEYKESSNLSWFGIVGIYLFTFSFACTWGPVVWTYQSEIFPLRIRAKGTGLSTMSNWFWNFVIALFTPIVNTQIRWYFYLGFALFCFLMTLWTYHFIPETRGKTLEEMDDVFGDNMAVLSTGEWDWRYDFRDGGRGGANGGRKNKSYWRFGRRRDGPASPEALEATAAEEEFDGTVEEDDGSGSVRRRRSGSVKPGGRRSTDTARGEDGGRSSAGPGHKNRKRSATPSPKRRRSGESHRGQQAPSRSSRRVSAGYGEQVVVVGGAAGEVRSRASNGSMHAGSESPHYVPTHERQYPPVASVAALAVSSGPSTPISSASTATGASFRRTRGGPKSPEEEEAADEEEEEEEEDEYDEEEEDDDEDEDDDDEDDEDEDYEEEEDEDEEDTAVRRSKTAEGGLQRTNSKTGSVQSQRSRKSAGTPVPERFLRRKNSGNSGAEGGGDDGGLAPEDESEEEEEDMEGYGMYGRYRPEDDVDSLEEELGIVSPARAARLAQAGAR
ncbi:hypothetical protein HDU96_002760 [Phlyctochytrium bullatum]|nr:hypothetical protein HDU96_002760 [Phlyctochytrium bullatum]